MAWTYRVGGLAVRSDLPLPCHETEIACADVVVELRPVTEPGPAASPGWVMDQGGAQVVLPFGAGLRVQGPGRIVVSAGTAEQRDRARACLPGLAFSMLFLLRATLPLHAGAVAVGGRAFLFLGHSGAGKSTLTAAFSALDDAVVLADDLAVPSWHDGKPFVWPTFPGLRLLPDAAAALRVSGTPTIDGKQWLAPPAVVPVAPLPIAALFLLGPRGPEQGEVRRLAPAEALPAVLREMKGNAPLAALPGRNAIFAQAAALCAGTPVFRIAVPPGVEGLGGFCRQLSDLGDV